MFKTFNTVTKIYLLCGYSWIPDPPTQLNPDPDPQHCICRRLSFDGQGCGSVFIWYGSWSSILGWIPIRIWIQSGSRNLITKNWKKFTYKNKNKFFLSKTTIDLYRYLNLQKGQPNYSFSSQKENIKHYKTWNFFNFFFFSGSFLPSWNRIWYGSTDLTESGFNTDPDPQPWWWGRVPEYGTLWKMVWSGSNWRTNSRPRALNLSSRDSRSSGRDRFNLGAATA